MSSKTYYIAFDFGTAYFNAEGSTVRYRGKTTTIPLAKFEEALATLKELGIKTGLISTQQ